MPATRAASQAFLAISRMLAFICSTPAATVWVFLLTCSEAAETTLAWAEVSSAFVPIWRLTADWVTDSSSAALVKLKCRAAASKPLKKSRDGSGGDRLAIPKTHAKHSEISFVPRPAPRKMHAVMISWNAWRVNGAAGRYWRC